MGHTPTSNQLVAGVQDKDLAPLRERREWLDALDTLKGGISDSALVQLRSEAKAPFRLARTILVGGLLAGASLGLLFITAKLVQGLQGAQSICCVDQTSTSHIEATTQPRRCTSCRQAACTIVTHLCPRAQLFSSWNTFVFDSRQGLQARRVLVERRAFRLFLASKTGHIRAGGEDLAQPLQNLAINGAAVAVLGFLLRRDLRASERDKVTVRREEALARLQARLLLPTVSWTAEPLADTQSVQYALSLPKFRLHLDNMLVAYRNGCVVTLLRPLPHRRAVQARCKLQA